MNRERADSVLDAIDHAIGDWAVSGDAMRWNPEGPAEQPIGEPAPAYVLADGQWQHLGYVTSAEFHMLPSEEVLVHRYRMPAPGEQVLTFELVSVDPAVLSAWHEGTDS